MRLVIQIGHTYVYSDKEGGVSIQDNVVIFADKSWCNVDTNQVVNNGRGTIVLSQKPLNEDGSPDDTITRGPEHYQASALDVNVLGKVTIDPYPPIHDNVGIEVIVKGPASRVKAIKPRVGGDTLYIHEEGRSGGVSIISSGGGNSFSSMVIGGGSVSIGGKTVITGGDHEGVELTFASPAGPTSQLKPARATPTSATSLAASRPKFPALGTSVPAR